MLLMDDYVYCREISVGENDVTHWLPGEFNLILGW